MKRKVCFCLALVIFFAHYQRLEAGILSGEDTAISLSTQVTHSGSLLEDPQGLALPKRPGTRADVWVLSRAIPVGLSWRPPRAVFLEFSVDTPLSTAALLGAFVRYGCDKKHWSTWQRLAPSARLRGQERGLAFSGSIDLPGLARSDYDKTMREWWKTNPDWASDEDAYCRWLLQKYPDYFRDNFPFIGYVQVYLEGSLEGTSDRTVVFRGLNLRTTWGVGGLHSLPKTVRPAGYDGQKWHFPD